MSLTGDPQNVAVDEPKRPQIPRGGRFVRDVASREVVSRLEWPNFRDAGRTVDHSLLRISENLQRPYGRGWASEGGYRKMVCQDTGLMPGATTVAKAFARLAAQGLIVQVWLVPGQMLPNKEVCTHGTRLVWVPKTDRQRYAAKRFAKSRSARTPYRTRNVAFDPRMLVARIAAAERPSMPAAGESAIEADRRRRAEQIAKLAILEQEWSHAESTTKGPGPPTDGAP
jgi:hypothetical protein